MWVGSYECSIFYQIHLCHDVNTEHNSKSIKTAINVSVYRNPMANVDIKVLNYNTGAIYINILGIPLPEKQLRIEWKLHPSSEIVIQVTRRIFHMS